MENFTSNLKRRFHAVYKPKERPSRPAKLRQLRKNVHLLDGTRHSEVSETTNVSWQTVTNASEFSDEESRLPLHNTTDGEVPAIDLDDALSAPTGPDAAQNDLNIASTVDNGGEDNCYTEATDGIEGHTNPDDAFMIDPEEAKAIREQTYITFSGEDESDYTEGPPRMILAADGVKNCAALLMTLGLSAKIQKAVRAQRDFAKARRIAVRKKEVYLHFSFDLESEIANHKSRLARLTGAEDADDAQKRRLEEELSILELMEEENQAQRQAIQASLDYHGQLIRGIYEKVFEDVEGAFIRARLMGPEDDIPDTPIEDLDLENQYEEFREQVGSNDNALPTSASPLDTNRDHMLVTRDPLTPEQERERELRGAVWAALERLQAAQFAFDSRAGDRQAEKQANFDAFERGEEIVDSTPEDFDLRWVKRDQELTHELIEAEAELSNAKAAAVQAGVDVPIDDRASGFVDDVANGYRMSMEQEFVASVPSPRVKNWLSDIPDVASPSFNERSEESDDWEAEDVEISDSVSLVAEGAERKRIDKWRQVCGF